MAKSAETQQQHFRRAKAKVADVRGGLDRPYAGLVKEYSPDADTTVVDSMAGRRILFNPQPHLGRNAWMRAAPEGGMGSLLITRSDSEEPEIMRWWHTDTLSRLTLYRRSVENLANGTGQIASREAFRPLQGGEIDIASKGGAQIFLGDRPHLDMRAGLIQLTMDQDETELTSKAPVHIRRGYQNVSNGIKDEERFGVVKRSFPGSFINYYYPDRQGNRGTDRNGFAKEYLMRLNSAYGSPAILVDHRIGHVLDDDGYPHKLSETGNSLRARTEYFTNAETTVLSQLDESGNFKIEHPSEATYGGLFILPSGTMRARIGVDFTRQIGRHELVDIGVDKIQRIGNDDSKRVEHNQNLVVKNDRSVSITGNQTTEIQKNRNITIIGDEVRVIQQNSTETVSKSKTIATTGELIIQTGSSTRMGFTDKSSAFETETLTIIAKKEIVFEAPSITFNTPIASFTGLVRTGNGVQSNGRIVAPKHDKGTAGAIIPGRVIKTRSL